MANKIKHKTNKSARKRFKINSKGSIKRKKAYLRHGMRKRSNDAKRNLRQKGLIADCDVASVKALLPNG